MHRIFLTIKKTASVTSFVACIFHWRISSKFYYGERMRHLNIRTIGNICMPSLPKSKLNYSVCWNDLDILTREQKNVFTRTEGQAVNNERLTIDQHHFTYLAGLNNKIFVWLSFVFNSCFIIHIEWTFVLICHT